MTASLTRRSCWLANCSMNPLTPSVLVVTCAGVVGIPYSACRQAGVVVVAQDAGTASEVTLSARACTPLRGVNVSFGAWIGWVKLQFPGCQFIARVKRATV